MTVVSWRTQHVFSFIQTMYVRHLRLLLKAVSSSLARERSERGMLSTIFLARRERAVAV